MTRKFDAPREIVWETITDPELIPHWYGFAADTTEVKKMDVRPAIIASGMESGARETYERLSELIASRVA